MKVENPKNSNDTVDHSVLKKKLGIFFTQTNTNYHEAALTKTIN